MKDGSKPSFKNILGRSLSRIIPFEQFSFLASPVGWHDRFSKTLVVPVNYGADQVKQIDLTQTAKSKVSTPIIIIVCLFFTIAIIGIFSSVVLLALNSARAKSRDAKRLADVRQIASALELYFNDNNKYPNTLNNLTSTYIDIIPTAPTPADGNCSSEQNQYTYTLVQSSQYSLTFCLGEVSGNYSAGVHILTQSGIDQSNSTSSPVINQTDQSQNQPIGNSSQYQNDPVGQADYLEGYKAGYADGRASQGQFAGSYSPPATTQRRPAYAQGYIDGFKQGCADGNFDCSSALNQLQQQTQLDNTSTN